MRRILLFAIPVLVLSCPALSGGLSAAGQDKTARGTVTAMSADSVTVKAGTQELKFSVDDKTTVVGPGTRTRPTKLGDVVAVGKAVVVNYAEMSGMLRASRIQVVTSAGAGGGSVAAAAPAAKTASGKVASVAANSLTVTSGGKDLTFVVDNSTNVVGRGAGTAAAAAGGRTPITALVGNGDTVSVTYDEVGTTMHAVSVRVTAKAVK